MPNPRSRWPRLYVVAAVCCFVAAWSFPILRAQFGTPERVTLLATNGFAYYAPLPSLLLDGDLDIADEVVTFYGVEGDNWILSGRYPIGVPLTLVIPFSVAHAVSWFAHAITGADAVAPNGFTIVYELFCFGFILTLWLAAMLGLHRLLVRRFGIAESSAAAGVLGYWLGSYFVWYLLTEPYWGHVLSATWIVITVCVIDRILEALDERRFVTWHWPALAFAISMAVVCRVTDVFLAPCFVYVGYRVVRSGFVRRALYVSPLMALGTAPVVTQLIIWQIGASAIASGDAPAVGYGEREIFHWSEPVLVPMLVSSLNGLLFWSPILLVAIGGWLWRLLRDRGWTDPLLVALSISALTLGYINACWYAWYFGECLGNRAFLELGVVFAMGLAFAFERVTRLRSRARRLALAAIASTVVIGYALMWGQYLVDDLRPKNDYLFEWEKRLWADVRR